MRREGGKGGGAEGGRREGSGKLYLFLDERLELGPLFPGRDALFECGQVVLAALGL